MTPNSDADYLYRVDLLKGLRLIHDGVFRPAHWPPSSIFQHRRLVELSHSVASDQDIYRICFWCDLHSAEVDLKERETRAKGAERPILMRVERAAVEACLAGWQTDEDDFIGPTACMYFSSLPNNTEKKSCALGIPLESLEYRDGTGAWLRLIECPELQPLVFRMQNIGMKSVAYNGFLGPNTAYWKRQQDLIVLCGDKTGTALSMVPDECIRLVSELLSTELDQANLHKVRVRVVHGGELEEFRLSVSARKQSLLARVRREPQAFGVVGLEFVRVIQGTEFQQETANMGLDKEDL